MAARTHTASRRRAAGRSSRKTDRRTRAGRAEQGDTRAAILNAAAEVVARRGLRDASVDEIAHVAGCSKGAVYWHFESKDDLFFALLEDRVDRPTREMIELLESAPPDQDMGPEASRRFVELLRGEPELLLLNSEYWSQATRDPAIRARYVERQRNLRTAVAKALDTRLEHLGTPVPGGANEMMAAVVMSLSAGLAQERLLDPDAVPDELLGRAIVLLYKGLVAEFSSA